MTNPIRQHYVPRFYLNNFINQSNDQIYVFDSDLKKSFKTKSHNIAIEKNFYTLHGTDEIISDEYYIEKALSVYEGKHSKMLLNILEKKELPSDKESFLEFIALTFVRGKLIRKVITDVTLEVLEKTINILDRQGRLPPPPPGLNKEDIKIKVTNTPHLIHMVEYFSATYRAIFANRNWKLIFSNHKDFHFITSDNPLISFMIEEKDFTFFSSPLHDIDGHLFFPLSPTVGLLGFYKSTPVSTLLEPWEVARLNSFMYIQSSKQIYSNSSFFMFQFLAPPSLDQNAIKKFDISLWM